MLKNIMTVNNIHFNEMMLKTFMIILPLFLLILIIPVYRHTSEINIEEVKNPKNLKYNIVKRYVIRYQGNRIQVTEILMKNVFWRNGQWTHRVIIYVPENRRNYDYCLLTSSPLNLKFSVNFGIKDVVKYGIPLVIVNNVPNNFILDENTMIFLTSINAIVKNKPELSLLYPMVTAYIKAITLSQLILNPPPTKYIVGGESKRGWVSLLVAKYDNRICGIVMRSFNFIDTKSYVEKMIENYQLEKIWGRIGNIGLLQLISILCNNNFIKEYDPLYFLDSTSSIPKLIILGTADELFPPGCEKTYYDHGKTWFCYIANLNHIQTCLSTKADISTTTFISYIVNNRTMPKIYLNYNLTENYIIVKSFIEKDGETILNVKLWYTYLNDPSFYNKKFYVKTMNLHGDQYIAELPMKKKIAAFFIELEFSTIEENIGYITSKIEIIDLSKHLNRI